MSVLVFIIAFAAGAAAGYGFRDRIAKVEAAVSKKV